MWMVTGKHEKPWSVGVAEETEEQHPRTKVKGRTKTKGTKCGDNRDALPGCSRCRMKGKPGPGCPTGESG